MTLEELQVVIDAETTGLRAELKSVQSQIGGLNKSVSSVTKEISKAFDETGANIGKSAKASNENVIKSAKSRAASLGAQYRKEGMSQSEAMKKAWSEIERDSAVGSNKVKKHIKDISANGVKTSKELEGSFKKSINKTSNMVSGILKGIAVSIAALGIGKLIKDSITSGIDAVESENLFEVSMGNMADTARSWSENLQRTLGLNGYELRKQEGLFYNYSTSMGIATKQAYGLSTGLTELQYDLASFFNKDTKTVGEDLSAVFTGEQERLRKYGVILTETTVKQYAYANGLASVGKELTEQQKIMARYGLLVQSTKNAQGDLARTINSPANQIRILTTQLQLIKINLGQAFIPIVQTVLPILNSFAKSLVTVTNYVAQFMSVLFGTNQATTNGGSAADNTAQSNAKLAQSYDKAGKAAKKAQTNVAAFDALNILNKNNSDSSDSSNSSGDISGTVLPGGRVGNNTEISESIKAAAENFKKLLEPLKNIDFTNLTNSLERVKKALEPLGEELFSGLEWFYKEVLVPLSKWTIEDYLPEFMNTLAVSIKALSTYLKGYSEVFQVFWDGFLAPLANYTADKFIEFLKKMNTDLGKLQSMLANSQIFSDLKKIIEPIAPILRDILKGLIDLVGFTLDLTWDFAINNSTLAFKDLEDRIGFVAAVIRGDFKDAWEHFKGYMGGNAIQVATDSLSKMGDKFDKLKKIIDDWVTNWSNSVGKFIYIWVSKIQEWWTKNVTPWFTAEKWNKVLFQIGVSLGLALNDFVTMWTVKIPNWWSNQVTPWFTIAKWKSLFSSVKTSMSVTVDEFVNSWRTKISGWWNNQVAPWFTIAKWKSFGANMKNGLISGFSACVDGIKGILNRIISAFGRLVNGVVDGVNKIISGYNSVASKTLLPEIGLIKRFSVPQLARGGIVDSPTLAMIGEKGKEAVVPLENTGFVNAIANSVASAVQSAFASTLQSLQNTGTKNGNNNQMPSTLILKIGETEFAKIVLNTLSNSRKQVSTILGI